MENTKPKTTQPRKLVILKYRLLRKLVKTNRRKKAYKALSQLVILSKDRYQKLEDLSKGTKEVQNYRLLRKLVKTDKRKKSYRLVRDFVRRSKTRYKNLDLTSKLNIGLFLVILHLSSITFFDPNIPMLREADERNQIVADLTKSTDPFDFRKKKSNRLRIEIMEKWQLMVQLRVQTELLKSQIESFQEVHNKLTRLERKINKERLRRLEESAPIQSRSESLGYETRALWNHHSKLKWNLTSTANQLASCKEEIAKLTEEISQLRSEMKVLNQEIDRLKELYENVSFRLVI